MFAPLRLELDTPCTARARSRPEMKILNRNIFEKTVQKNRSKTVQNIFHLSMIFTQWPLFFKKFQNRCFKTSPLRGMCPPLISASQKSPKIRTDGRTDERTNERTDGTRGFDLPTDVKSASRKNVRVRSK